jgi:hypothetical protein
LPEHNRRFTRPTAASEDYHCKVPGAVELREIFRLENERTVSDDGVVRYDNCFCQLQQPSRNNVCYTHPHLEPQSRQLHGLRANWRENTKEERHGP